MEKARTILITAVAASIFALCGAAFGVTVLEPGYSVEEYAAYSSAGIGIGMAMACDGVGNLYVLHQDGGSIWRISSDRVADEFVSGLLSPRDIEWGGGTSFGDYLFVIRFESWSGGVYRIGLDATVANFADMISGGHGPTTIGLDDVGNYGGNIYVGTGSQDRTYRVTTSGDVSLFANFPGWTDDGAPRGIAFGPNEGYAGQMYMGTSYPQSDQHISGLFTLSTSGVANRFSPDLVQASYIEFDDKGDFGSEMFVRGVSVYGESSSIWRVSPDGAASEFANTTLTYLTGFVFGMDGAMYVVENDENSHSVVITRISKADDGLVGHWKFDEGSGSIAHDSAGNNDGVVYGASWADGVLGGALDFDGDMDYVEIPDDDSLNPSSAITISWWVKTRGGQGANIRKYAYCPHEPASPGNSRAYALGLSENGVGMVIASGPSSVGEMGIEMPVSVNEWHHGVGTFDRGEATLYLDGNAVISDTLPVSSIMNDVHPLYIGGCWSYCGTDHWVNYLDGLADDVRIYNRALSAGEVGELYGQGADDGLVGHWKFDEGSGSIAYDSAGNNEGTVYGATWADGVLGGALDFDGVDDFVDIGDKLNDVDVPFSIAAWLNTSGDSVRRIFTSDETGDPRTMLYLGFWLGISRGSDIHVGYGDGEGATASNRRSKHSAAGAIPQDAWVFVSAVVRGPADMSLYVDGQDIGGEYDGTGGGMVHNTYGAVIGLNSTWGPDRFNGQIDDLRIYDRALSDVEIQGLYESQRPARVYHVDGVNGNDGWDGLSVDTAFETIQKGIDTAADRDTVLVWPGIYVERVNFKRKAITVKSADYPAVIEAPWQDAVSFHLGEGPDSVLANFVIRGSGAAVACNNESSPMLKNLTIVDNDFGIAAYESSNPHISNCILWNNWSGDLFQCEALYSLVEQDVNDPVADGPLFADVNGGDYHLLSEKGRYVPAYGLWSFDDETSPGVDSGDPSDDPGYERMPNGGRINIGAYGGTAYASMSEWPLTHDKNKDGRTNFTDLASFCDEWLAELPWAPPPGTPEADRTPPQPDPATWEIEAYSTSSSTILMGATEATDENGTEYYFENVTIPGHTSGWQSSPNWNDSGLDLSTQYCYRVKTRDKSPNLNESGWSSTLCATTSGLTR